MTNPNNSPLVLQALEAAKNLDRRRAAALLRRDLAQAPATGQRWLSVARLAQNLGEKDLELEAMQRFSQTQPQTLDHILAYGQTLARSGRFAEVQALIDALPLEAREHPGSLHFRAMVATETGDFPTAEALFRGAVTALPTLARSWYGLAVIKTFSQNDPDLERMEALRHDFSLQPGETQAAFLYALGKAWHDAGDIEKSARAYNDGAALMRGLGAYNAGAWLEKALHLCRDYTSVALAGLLPSRNKSTRVTFVTGLPRSGTTLVEQILTSHSTVVGGGELNLIRPALIPTADASLASALAYQTRNLAADPWGQLADDYLDMVSDRFPGDGLVIDKTLNQSATLGLLLHMLPKAKIVWMRRDPSDCALSIFRTHFLPPTMRWSWSPNDIALRMRGEDMLHAHWVKLFPDRILTVFYEDLVSDSQVWIRRILNHVGLPEEPQVFEPHKSKRVVTTASVAQVRAPISTARIGAAEAYKEFTEEFRRAYYGGG